MNSAQLPEIFTKYIAFLGNKRLTFSQMCAVTSTSVVCALHMFPSFLLYIKLFWQETQLDKYPRLKNALIAAIAVHSSRKLNGDVLPCRVMASCSHLAEFTKDGLSTYRKVCAWFVVRSSREARRKKVCDFTVPTWYTTRPLWPLHHLPFPFLGVLFVPRVWHLLESPPFVSVLCVFWLLLRGEAYSRPREKKQSFSWWVVIKLRSIAPMYLLIYLSPSYFFLFEFLSAVDLTFGVVYCFACGDYVYAEHLENILREEKAKGWMSIGMFLLCQRGRSALIK